MKIVEIRERTIAIGSALRNARVSFDEMTVSAVAILTDQFRDGRRVTGYAFNSFGRYACAGPLRERFIPRLMNAMPAALNDPHSGIVDPQRALRLLLSQEKPGAHAERSMAVGTLEIALWDIVGKMQGLPLYQVLRARRGAAPLAPDASLPCYAGGGFYKEADDLGKLDAEIGQYLETGYTQVKIKAGGLPLADDLRRIEAVLRQVGAGHNLALDASCAFNREQALAYAQAIEPYDLRWLEEPCDPADFATYRAVSQAYSGMLAGGENTFSTEEVGNFLRYSGFEGRLILQPDPPLAYGICEFETIIDTALHYGVARENIMPHGGNMMSLHVAAGYALGSAESYPGLFGAFGGFSREVTLCNGRASLPAAPGIGFEEQPALFDVLSHL